MPGSMKHALIALAVFVSVQGTALSSDNPTRVVRVMVGQEHFAPEPGSLYVGIPDKSLRDELNARIDAAVEVLAGAADAKASTAQLLAILREQLGRIDRDALDTDDAEHVAGLFEQMLDDLGIGGSDGAINEWLYEVDPT
jgi:hypothetical protein